MNEENIKIAKIKKSCKVGNKVSNILSVFAIVGCVCTIIASVAIFGMGRDFDIKVQQGIETGVINSENEFGSVKMFDINVGTVKKWHSDVPALQKILDEQPYSITYGTYFLLASLFCAACAVILKLLGSVFELIIKEDSPFTDKVIKKVMTVLITLSVILLFTASAGFAALGGIITWVVYTIMDYVKTLQIQSDETL